MSDKKEKNLQFRDARCCESNNKKCNDNISKIEQLLSMAICNTTSIELEFNDIILKEQDTRYNVINFKEQKNVKLRESIALQNHFKDSMGAINDNNIHSVNNNRTVVNDIY